MHKWLSLRMALAAHRQLSYFRKEERQIRRRLSSTFRSPQVGWLPFDKVAMDSKLANESRKALIAEARRLTREERLRAFARHSKLVIELYNAARRVPSKSAGGG
jgi:hypothetical protein